MMNTEGIFLNKESQEIVIVGYKHYNTSSQMIKYSIFKHGKISGWEAFDKHKIKMLQKSKAWEELLSIMTFRLGNDFGIRIFTGLSYEPSYYIFMSKGKYKSPSYLINETQLYVFKSIFYSYMYNFISKINTVPKVDELSKFIYYFCKE